MLPAAVHRQGACFCDTRRTCRAARPDLRRDRPPHGADRDRILGQARSTQLANSSTRSSSPPSRCASPDAWGASPRAVRLAVDRDHELGMDRRQLTTPRGVARRNAGPHQPHLPARCSWRRPSGCFIDPSGARRLRARQNVLTRLKGRPCFCRIRRPPTVPVGSRAGVALRSLDRSASAPRDRCAVLAAWHRRR